MFIFIETTIILQYSKKYLHMCATEQSLTCFYYYYYYGTSGVFYLLYVDQSNLKPRIKIDSICLLFEN